MDKVYVIQSFFNDDNETLNQGVFSRFDDAKEKATSLINDFKDDVDYNIVEITDANHLKMYGVNAVYVCNLEYDSHSPPAYEVTIFEEKVK